MLDDQQHRQPGSSTVGYRRAVRRAALLLTALMLVGACSTPMAGAPSPAPSTSAVAPQRPRELRLDGIDPCSLLTPAQRTQLGLDQQSRAYTSGHPAPGPACSIVGFQPRAIGVGIALVLTAGIADITRPGAVSDELTPTTVVGFPAVIARPRNPDGCVVDVDVANGQVIDALYRDGGGTPSIPQAELCRSAIGLAEQVIASLLAR